MKSTRMILMAFGVVIAASSALAVTTKWKGEDGDWNDPAMWDNGVPGPADSAELPYVASRAPGGYVIAVSGDFEVGELHFMDGGAEVNGDGPVTFVGDGRLLISHKTFFRPVIVDGPVIDFSGDSTEAPIVRQDITVKSGAFVYTNAAHEAKMYFNCDNSSAYRPMQTYLSGGLLQIDIYSCYDVPKSILHQTGGTFEATTFADISQADSYRDYPQLDLKGGTFRLGSRMRLGGKNTYDFGRATIKNDVVSFDGGAAYADIWFYDRPRFLIGSQLLPSSSGPVVHFPHGVEFASYGDWSLYQLMSFDGRENIVFDTLDALDGETKRTVTGWQYGFRMKRRNAIAIKGGGTFNINNSEALFSNTTGASSADLDIFDSFSILDGTYFRLNSKDVYRANRIYAEEFVMDDATTFEFKAYNTFIVATRATIGAGAKLVVEIPASPASYAANEHAVFHSTYVTTLANLAVELTGEGAADYDVRRTDRTIFLRRKDYTPAVSDASYKWVGKGADANVSTGANWNDGTDKTSLWNYQVGIRATEGLEMNNDLGVQSIYRFELDGGAGPFRVTGDPLKFLTATIDGSYAAINNNSKFPLTFENQVCQAANVAAFAVESGYSANNCGSVTELLGGVDVANLFYVQGLVKVGGEAVMGRLQLAKALGFAAALEVLDGANVSVTNQLLEGANVASCSSSFLRVDRGGVLRFTGGTGYLDNYAHTHDVNGTLAFDIPLVSAAENQTFAGYGRLEISDVLPGGGNDVAVHVAEKLKVYPKDWNTVVAAHPANKVTLVVDTHATLGALQDWTYGPAAGVAPTTSAADRALVVANHETLTVDTENPDTGAAQTITFVDPLAAGWDVVKQGAGTLAFATTGNTVAGTFRVTDGQVALGGALADAQVWTDVLTAKSVELAEGTVPSDYRAKVVSNGDGTVSLRFRKAAGLLMMIR